MPQLEFPLRSCLHTLESSQQSEGPRTRAARCKAQPTREAGAKSDRGSVIRARACLCLCLRRSLRLRWGGRKSTKQPKRNTGPTGMDLPLSARPATRRCASPTPAANHCPNGRDGRRKRSVAGDYARSTQQTFLEGSAAASSGRGETTSGGGAGGRGLLRRRGRGRSPGGRWWVLLCGRPLGRPKYLQYSPPSTYTMSACPETARHAHKTRLAKLPRRPHALLGIHPGPSIRRAMPLSVCPSVSVHQLLPGLRPAKSHTRTIMSIEPGCTHDRASPLLNNLQHQTTCSPPIAAANFHRSSAQPVEPKAKHVEQTAVSCPAPFANCLFGGERHDSPGLRLLGADCKSKQTQTVWLQERREAALHVSSLFRLRLLIARSCPSFLPPAFG
ncbi:hypothetical protein K505DRAFT_334836 [Melanomma pulvis-pyrius CBS 109.77]|uniref:Uncharacterized protein n=1 Tax=Melanomma pulvis-pyrius CBS 109.77 TaxID=1314802 RepID=A0A6A6XMN6_9PLEO|nr:hypothetical protein K505DRAFT_334836 [Melanomma pulvis-pyrius CBS 109.77]